MSFQAPTPRHSRPGLALAEPAPSPESLIARDAQVRFDILQASLQSSRIPLLLQSLVAVGLAWLCWRAGAAGDWPLAWLAVVVGCSAVTFRWIQHCVRRPPGPRDVVLRLRVFTAIAITGGLIWAAGVALLYFDATPNMIAVVAVSLLGVTYVATHSMHLHLPAFLGFISPLWCSVLAQVLLMRTEFWPWKAAFIVLFWAGSCAVAVLGHRRYITLQQQRWLLAWQAVDLHRLSQRAEQALLTKSRFLAAASHDLRQPVHALALLVGALRRRPQDREGQRLLTHLEATVQSMAVQFGALLDLSRLEAGALRPERRRFDLWPLLERVAADEALLAGRKRLRLRLKPARGVAEGPLLLHSDPLLLERILRNLTANAVRYTERGGVLIQVRCAAAGVVIQVADSGIGIEPEHQAGIFEPFVQGHLQLPERRNGLGLGLAIVRQLVDLLGLQLRLRSRPGQGTVFRLRLPLPPPGGDSGARAPDSLQSTAASGWQEMVPGALVLVVDDDGAIRAGLTSLLASWNLEVVAAANAADLWPKLLALPDVPDLIICDLCLDDGVDGATLIDRLREEYNQPIPALLVTADPSAQPLQQASAGARVLLHKPLSPQALRQAVASALAPSAAATALPA